MEEKSHDFVPIRHIAFIMDGNGRWAKKRLLPRYEGHKVGVDQIKKIVVSCFDDYDIHTVSLFAFSTENWDRPQKELDVLFKLLKEFFEREIDYFMERETKIVVLGLLEDPRIPKATYDVIKKAIERTKDNKKNVFQVLFNYGSQIEIADACKRIALDVKDGKLNIEDINKESFKNYLWTKEFSDVDLLVRTSGEERLSNCLLYQIAYAEFIFEDTLWPDYNIQTLKKDIEIYRHRNRRFGAIKQ